MCIRDRTEADKSDLAQAYALLRHPFVESQGKAYRAAARVL